jgi:HD-GYP domain-containing protein (c-di-GMP phosphodiesterase class II)
MSETNKLSEFLAYIVIALSNCSLYSPEHQSVEEFTKKAFPILDYLYDEDLLTFTLLSNSFIYNDVPVTINSPHLYRFIKILKSKKIERLVIKKGITLIELKSLIIALASREEKIPTSPNITVGILEVRFKDEENLASLVPGCAKKIGEAFEGVSKYRKLDIRSIEDVVGSFITAVKRDAKVLQNLISVRKHSMYTYVHETNVSLLVIFQAETLGLEGEALHDAGLAGLLHDMGKLFVPKGIIDKQEFLDEKEWNIMKLHPVYGALYLSSLPDVPKTAVIAAYEHHLKFDGTGYPEAGLNYGGQHMISQLVAIADVFDALRSKRGYRHSYNITQIMEVLKKGSGKDFSPPLVDNFITACKKSMSV